MSPSVEEKDLTCGITAATGSYTVYGVYPIYTTGTFTSLDDESTALTYGKSNEREKWCTGVTHSPIKQDSAEGKKLSPSKIAITNTGQITQLKSSTDNYFCLYLGFGTD